jgi:hypothetical protein
MTVEKIKQEPENETPVTVEEIAKLVVMEQKLNIETRRLDYNSKKLDEAIQKVTISLT